MDGYHLRRLYVTHSVAKVSKNKIIRINLDASLAEFLGYL